MAEIKKVNELPKLTWKDLGIDEKEINQKALEIVGDSVFIKGNRGYLFKGLWQPSIRWACCKVPKNE
jgi:hypothetical protein